jgi:site-specific DNA-methyltransferase (adenine-specific)
MKYEIYCDDCLKKMKDIKDNSIDLVLIDPPYNIGKDKWDKWKSVEDYVVFMGKVFKEIERVLKSNGSFYFFHNDFLQIVKLQTYIENNTNFIFRNLLIWNKRFDGASNKGFLDGFCEVNGLRNYQKMAEYCLFYTFQDGAGSSKIKSDVNNFSELRKYSKELQKYLGLSLKKINEIMGSRRAEHFFYHSTTQWELCTKEVYELLIEKFNIDKWDKFKEYEILHQEYEKERYAFNNQKTHHSVMNYEIAKKQGHLTPKPVDLLEYLIKTSSNENNVVLDCFMGSGSTGAACMNTNRKFIGIEINEKYFEIAKKRIEESLE